MKKFLLPFLMLTAPALTVMAEEVLTQITTESGVEQSEFTYNEKGLLIRQDNTDDYGKHYTLLTYDANDHIIRIETHQDLYNNGEFMLVNYIDYQYNDKGQLSQRENYNYDSYTGGYTKGGRIVYTYNEKGLMTDQTVYMTAWDSSEESVMQEFVYSYNEADQLIEELMKMSDFFNPGAMTNASQILYTYDAEGRRATSTDYFFDSYSPDVPILLGSNKYTYDENGLCLFERMNESNVVEGKDEYTFATENADETIYPYDIETPNTNFVYANAKKRIATRKEYDTDLNSGQLAVFDTYTYHYAPNQAGVTAITRPESVLTVLNDGENVVLRGLNVGEKVMVFDMTGKMVVNRTAPGQTLSLSGLASGVYVARTATGVAKFSVK